MTVNSDFLPGLYLPETSRMRSFATIKPSQNGEISLSCTDKVNYVQVANFKRGKYVF